MRGHGVYEALSGAIALGEATPDERARFVAHAAGCDRCRADLTAPALVPVLRTVAEDETWRPDARGAVLDTIASRRRARVRALGGAIACAAVLSIAVDLGVSNGDLGRFVARFESAPDAPVAFVRRSSPSKPAGVARVPAAASATPAPVSHVRHRRIATPPSVARAAAGPKAAVPAADAGPTSPYVDDLYSGLAIDPAGEARAPHVAKADSATDAPEPGAGTQQP